MKLSENGETFFIYIVVIIGILLLRVFGNYPEQVILFFHSTIAVCEEVVKAAGLTKIVQFFSSFPIGFLILIGGCVQITIGLIVLLIFKGSMEQGTMILLKQPFDAIKAGLCLYFLIVSIVFIFTYSVIGIPFSVTLIGLNHLFIFLGSIPLSIFLGYLLAERLNISGYTIIYYFIGSFIKLLCESIYTLGGAFIFFIFPVLSMGTLFLLIVNRNIYKISYAVKFRTKAKEEPFDRKKIRDIITKGLK